MPTSTIVSELRELLERDQVVTDDDVLEQYSHDDAEWAAYVAPLAVVLARATEDVARVVRFAADSGIQRRAARSRHRTLGRSERGRELRSCSRSSG